MKRKLIATLALGALLALGAAQKKNENPQALFGAAVHQEEAEGNLTEAIRLYQTVLQKSGADRKLAADALFRIGQCYERLGQAEARKAYERLVREFSDQKERARDAQARLAAMGQTATAVNGIVAQQIKVDADFAGDGRVTPDGRSYLFTDWETGDLAALDLHTGQVKRLTNKGTWEHSDSWGGNVIPSRDGKRLAYGWYGPHDKFETLRVMNIDGTGVRTVARKSARDVFPCDWSPDGNSIAGTLADRNGSSGIVTVDLKTGEEHQLRTVESPSRDIDVAGFSPDGRWIVYSRRRVAGKDDFDIFAVDRQTGQETVVVQGTGADRQPLWVPGTDKILFRSDRNGKNAVWMVRFQDGRAAGAPVFVKPDTGDYQGRGISRDGSLFYTVKRETREVYQATVDPKTLRAQDTPTWAIETYGGRNARPAWSPAGDSFAYFSQRADVEPRPERLVVRYPDGKETVIAQPMPHNPLPQWCQTGDRLAGARRFLDARTGEASGEVFDLRIPAAPYTFWAFSPDCKSVYVTASSFATKRYRVYRIDIATAKETELFTETGRLLSAPYVSPDGRWLAFIGVLPAAKSESGLLLLSTGGGTPRVLAENPSPMSGGAITWTPDSKRLMYPRFNATLPGRGYEHELYWVSVEGGTPQSMGIRMPGVSAPSLNADGRRILFSATEKANELWVLRNLPLD